MRYHIIHMRPALGRTSFTVIHFIGEKSERVIGYRAWTTVIGDQRDDKDVVMPAPVTDIHTSRTSR